MDWLFCRTVLCTGRTRQAESRSSLVVMDEQGSEAAGMLPAAQLAEQQRSLSGRDSQSEIWIFPSWAPGLRLDLLLSLLGRAVGYFPACRTQPLDSR